MNTSTLCETHLERGFEVPADIVTPHLAMCWPCYRGKAICPEEKVGNTFKADCLPPGSIEPPRTREAKRAYNRRYSAAHREQTRKRDRERWRREKRAHRNRMKTDKDYAQSFLANQEILPEQEYPNIREQIGEAR